MSIEAIDPNFAPAKAQASTNKEHAMKKFLFLTCVSLMLSVILGNSALAGPPGSGISNYYIVKQGNGVIYSNGQMQAAVTVHYELASGLTMSNIELLQMFTRAPIADMGWIQSTDDNGFEHEIYGQRRSSAVRNARSGPGHGTYFVSTQNNGSVDVCFKLTASDGSFVDTCDGSTSNAFVSLQAIPPVVYSGRDFELRQKDSVTSGGSMTVITASHGMYCKHQPFNVHSVSGTIDQDTIEIDTEVTSLMTTDMSGTGVGVQQGSAYLGSSELMEYKYIDSENFMKIIDMTMVDNPILKVVQQSTLIGMYASDYLCEAWSDSSISYECSKYSLGGPVPTVPAGTIEAYLVEKPSKTIKIVDTYGTEHSIVVKIDLLNVNIEE